MNNGIKKKLTLLIIYASAMGLLEAAVVVYLRYLFYPAGFKFPMVTIPDFISRVELLREFCTIIMLLAVSWIAGKNKIQIFSFFLFSFAVWDILYYAGLKLFLDWPPSMFTWDILFLIPIPWVGPVLAPLICSLSMIALAMLLLFVNIRQITGKVKRAEWFLIYLGAIIIFVSFILDFAEKIITNHFLFANTNFFNQTVSSYVPHQFHWEIFSLGIALVYLSMFSIAKRTGLFKFIPTAKESNSSVSDLQ